MTKRLHVLRHAAFRNLWLASSTSVMGDDILWNTAMAERIPPHALSRASSYEWMGSLILLPVGLLAAGPAAEATSPEAVLLVGGVLTAIVLSLGLIPRETRQMRRIERHGSHV